jgi:cytochrome c-type biogenesis protein CcmH
MLWFWLIAAAVAAFTGLLIAGRAAAATRRLSLETETPAVAVYRRQMSELDDLATRDLIPDSEIEAARTEASRRLLSASDTAPAPEKTGSPRVRLIITALAAVTALGALGLYLLLGRPGMPDQPYRARLTAWRNTDPSHLTPPEMAAVLKVITAEHPDDPQAFAYLGRAQMAAGEPGEAARAFAHASKLSPKDPDLKVAYGEAMMTVGEGKITPDARAAFEAALAINPGHDGARYYLARAKIASGDVAGGLADWKTLVATLPAGDPHRQLVEGQILLVEKTGGLTDPAAEQADASSAGNQSAFIQAMVSRLAARLQAQPDDPDGWARLVRAYGVLKDDKAKAAALDRARQLFAKRPDALAKIEAQAQGGAPAPSMPGQ